MLAMFRSVVMRGMDAVLDGVLLGRQAEGVVAHRVQDVVALHATVAADDVGGGVALRVADVQARAAGVGEHVQDVELGLAGSKPGSPGLGRRNVSCFAQYSCHFFSMARKSYVAACVVVLIFGILNWRKTVRRRDRYTYRLPRRQPDGP